MPVPQFYELMNPTLRALRALGGSASINEIADKVAQDMELPPSVIEQHHGDTRRTKLEYRLAWARTYLKQVGLLTNSERGVWALTEAGAVGTEVDPQAMVKRVQAEHRERKTAHLGDESASEGAAPGAADNWRDELMAVLVKIPPKAFERLCQRILRESGFIQVEVTGRSGDGGIDGHGIIRLAGLISFPVIFQAKRHQGSVGPNVVREVRGAMVGRADKGVIITTGGFTQDARKEATRDGAPPIDLIDGELLVDKPRELRLGVRTKMVEAMEIDHEWFNSI